jgi:hypothetical protein
LVKLKYSLAKLTKIDVDFRSAATIAVTELEKYLDLQAQICYARKMRRLLTFMAVLAMLVSPALAGTKVGCPMGAGGSAMAVSMTSVAHPCCDPGAKTKSMNKGCAQMCASPGVVAIAIAPMTVDAPLAFATLVMTAPNPSALPTFEPVGLKRPPKSIA